MAFQKRWGDVDAPNQFGDNVKRVDELFGEDLYQLPKNKLVAIRLIGDVVIPVGMHWIDILTPKLKKKMAIGTYCPNFNPETEKPDLDNGCRACEEDVRLALRYVTNAIIRPLQEKGDRNPVRVIDLPVSVISNIIELQEANMVRLKDGSRKPAPLNHPRFGCDVLIKYNPKKSGSEMYMVSKDQRTPLTKEERRYELIDLTPLEEELEKVDLIAKKVEDLMKRAVSDDRKDETDNGEEEWDDDNVADAEDWEDDGSGDDWNEEEAPWDDESGDDGWEKDEPEDLIDEPPPRRPTGKRRPIGKRKPTGKRRPTGRPTGKRKPTGKRRPTSKRRRSRR